MSMRLSRSIVGEAEARAVSRVLLEDGYLGMGNEVRLFEEEVARYLGVRPDQVITTNTGTAALHLAEQWREKLLSAAEADVDALLAAFPWPDAEAAGRPELEKLLAEARREDDRRPPHARRALFRGIMRLLEQR